MKQAAASSNKAGNSRRVNAALQRHGISPCRFLSEALSSNLPEQDAAELLVSSTTDFFDFGRQINRHPVQFVPSERRFLHNEDPLTDWDHIVWGDRPTRRYLKLAEHQNEVPSTIAAIRRECARWHSEPPAWCSADLSERHSERLGKLLKLKREMLQ